LNQTTERQPFNRRGPVTALPYRGRTQYKSHFQLSFPSALCRTQPTCISRLRPCTRIINHIDLFSSSAQSAGVHGVQTSNSVRLSVAYFTQLRLPERRHPVWGNLTLSFDCCWPWSIYIYRASRDQPLHQFGTFWINRNKFLSDSANISTRRKRDQLPNEPPHISQRPTLSGPHNARLQWFPFLLIPFSDLAALKLIVCQ